MYQYLLQPQNHESPPHLYLIAIPATIITLILYPTACIGVTPSQALKILGILRNETPKHNIELAAKEYVGIIPYKWGGTSIKEGMDCSAFTRHIMNKFGVNLPRTAQQQARAGREASLMDLEPGDLIFFDASRTREGIDHVGLYMGRGYMIHSESPDGVKISDLNSYKHRPVTARRVAR